MEQQNNGSVWRQVAVPVLLVILFVIAIFGVLRIRQEFVTSPDLEVNIPEISNTTEEKTTISGTTAKDVDLTINDKKVEVDKEGNFSYETALSPGENKLTFKATREGSDPTIVEKIVIRENKVVATTTAPTAMAVTSGAGVDGLTSSGPAENIGAVALTLLILAGGLYYRSRKALGLKNNVSYKPFTN